MPQIDHDDFLKHLYRAMKDYKENVKNSNENRRLGMGDPVTEFSFQGFFEWVADNQPFEN